MLSPKMRKYQTLQMALLTVACVHVAAGALVDWASNSGGRELLLAFDAPVPNEAAQATAWTLSGADVVSARIFANGTGVAVTLAEPLDTRSDYVLNGPGVSNFAIRRPRPPDLPERLVRGAVEPPGAGSRRSAVSFTEVMVASPAGGRDLRFAELYNSNPYPERIGGWSLSGAFKYTFPADYTLAANAYVVVAADAAAVRAAYGIDNVVEATKAEAPFAKKLSLADERGGDLGSVKFADAEPWPSGVNGTGHSLVLARPSYGWTVPEGWSRSAYPGGSPGRAEPPRPQGAMRVLVNEVCPHGGSEEGFVELYNVADSSAALAGYALEVVGSGRPPFVFGFGRSIAPHRTLAVGEQELGFPLGGEGVEVVLRAPAAAGGWIVDALRVAPVEIGRTVGRYPDGGPLVSRLVRPTRNARNVARVESPVVLNEIMYHPITEGKDEEYVELYNPTDADVDLTGWKLSVDGKLGYAFTEKISAGGYLVLPKKKKVFKELYPEAAKFLTNDNCAESLSNSRGRLVLTRGLSVWSAAAGGMVEADVPMEEVEYRDGGAWGKWCDGGGSSLERVDPHADARLAGSWADSDESGTCEWRTIEWTGPVELGRANDSYSVPDEVQFGLYDAGECLVDSVEVFAADGPNLVKNASFEADDTANDWRAFGTHAKGAIEAGAANDGTKAYHLRACDRLSNGGNCVHGRLTAALPTSGTGTIRAKVKWLAGSPDFLIRVRGNWLEACGDILSTRAMGTPGRANSRAAAATAPAISSVVHLPILPKAGERTAVWARIDAAAGVAGADLVWRLDGAAECRRVAMRPADGGWWRGDLPGSEAGQLVAFHVEARGADASGRSARYPEAAEGLVRFGEEPTDGTFGVYRLWVTASEVERWYAQNRDSNEPRDMTFVAGNDRVVYGAGAEYGGSSWNGKSYPRPGTASSFIDYKADFPKDEPFLGDDGLVLATPGNRGNDKTAVKEQFAYALLRRLGRPSLHRRFVHVLFNGVAQNPMKIHEDTEKPNGSVLEHLFPDKDDGRLYKLDDWFEYDVDAFTNFSTDSAAARLAVYRGADGAYKTARYRWPWLPRACDNFQPSDYTAFFGLLDAVNAEPALSDEDLEAVFNAEALAEVLAVNHFICNNDSYGYGRGKNMYLYEGPAGWEFIGWDMDYSFGDNGVSLTTTLDPTSPSFPCGDPVAKEILQRPVNLRRYWEAIRLCAEAADSSSPECAEARAKFNALAADGAVVRDLEANFFAKMAERRAFAVESAASVESVESVAGVASVAGGRSGTTATQKAADGVVEDPVAEPAAFGLAAERGGRVVPRILAVQQPDTTVTWWPCDGAASALGRLYVDSHIRLMPWGEDADPTEYLQPDERFRLWTQLDETGRTNLFVTALQYDDDGWETFVGTNVFRIANSIDLSGETWRRLTVRAVADVTRAKARNPEVYPEGVQGFLVWLDGELLRTAPDDGSFTDDYVNFLAYEPDPAWGWLDWESPVDREVADLLQSGTVFADLRGAEAGGVSDVGFFGLGAIDNVMTSTELAGFVSGVDFMLLSEGHSAFAGVPHESVSAWLASIGRTFADAMTDARAHESFLLNLGLGLGAAPQLKIVRMAPGDAGEWNVTVKALVNDEAVLPAGGFNGSLAVRAAATLAGLETAEGVVMPFVLDAANRETTIRVNPRAGSFFRVTLQNP